MIFVRFLLTRFCVTDILELSLLAGSSAPFWGRGASWSVG